MRPHGTPKQLEARRRLAVELLGKMKPADVARKVGCSLSSVYWWQKHYQQYGQDGLKAVAVPGRPAKLNQRRKNSLIKILLRGALKNGYSTELWTTKRIAEVIERRFGVEYHSNHVWRILIDLGWSCQKPEKRAKQRDEKAIAHWKRHQWPHIKKRQEAASPADLSRRKWVFVGATGPQDLGS